MKKYLPLVMLFATVLFSCQPKESNLDVEQQEDQSTAKVKDSTIAGADKDENGCLASAGYTWSKLNKECIKAFTGIQLNPADNPDTEDETLCAYLLFNEGGDKAEVFLPDEKSFILTKNNKEKRWTSGEYQLILKNGYILMQNGATIFSGDAQIGNKVTGSDNPEGQE